MKKFIESGNFAFLVLGIGIGIFLLRVFPDKTKNNSGSFDNISGTIKKGDKGKDIEQFQKNINLLMGKCVPQNGMYCKQTASVVGDVFAGTDALKDPENGEIKKSFINDFNTMFENLDTNNEFR
ncbi:MAG: hypothetical protein ACTSXG_00570 [Alphaproteobacteria bacterium]